MGDVPHWLFHALAWTWGGDGQGGAEGAGYLITSGPLAASAVVGASALFVWTRLCSEPRCFRPSGHHDYRTGKTLCEKHYRLALPKSAHHWIRVVAAANGCELESRDLARG